MSPTYRVWASASGIMLWEGPATSPTAAIGALAHDLGGTAADLPDALDDLLVEELGCEAVYSVALGAWLPPPRWWASRQVCP